VGIGTLLHLAKENGFVMPTANEAPSKPDPATAARLARERAASQEAEKARQAAAHAHAASEATTLWAQSSEIGASPYLIRKGVEPYGVRFTADGWLLVPLRDANGTLHNLQRIAPAKPESGAPEKLFLKGGRKSGLWHWCGDPAGAGVLLIAEGYATAASLHQATGRPVAVAFDAGNLAHVAKALRKAYPAALLVLCGDDDAQTLAKSGHNPGRDKATAAAGAVHGLAVFPEALPDGGSDFNDMHQAAGLEAVRLLVDWAIDAFSEAQTAAQAAAHAAQNENAGKGSQNKRRKPNGSNSRTADSGDSDGGRTADRFTVDDSGVWFNGVDQHGDSKPPEWVCSALHVEALTRDQDGGGWGYLLAFDDPLGNPKQWAMPSTITATQQKGFYEPGFVFQLLRFRRLLMRRWSRRPRTYWIPDQRRQDRDDSHRQVPLAHQGIANYRRGTDVQHETHQCQGGAGHQRPLPNHLRA
jgi:putative DNA primase/helicase